MPPLRLSRVCDSQPARSRFPDTLRPFRTIRWTFVAAVYDQKSGNATLFVDGIAVTSQTSIPQGGMVSRTANTDGTTAPPEDNSAGNLATSLRFGAGYSATGAADGSTGFIGVIDEAFVYGTALTVDELDYLYRAAQVI